MCLFKNDAGKTPVPMPAVTKMGNGMIRFTRERELVKAL
jgi:hypothetical protein